MHVTPPLLTSILLWWFVHTSFRLSTVTRHFFSARHMVLWRGIMKAKYRLTNTNRPLEASRRKHAISWTTRINLSRQNKRPIISCRLNRLDHTTGIRNHPEEFQCTNKEKKEGTREKNSRGKAKQGRAPGPPTAQNRTQTNTRRDAPYTPNPHQWFKILSL
jgi:hypothetical protein